MSEDLGLSIARSLLLAPIRALVAKYELAYERYGNDFPASDLTLDLRAVIDTPAQAETP